MRKMILTAGLILGALFGTGAIRGWAHAWVRFHNWCARWLLGIRTVVEGPRPAGAMLVAVKHQSMFETMEMVRLLDEPATGTRVRYRYTGTAELQVPDDDEATA